MKHLASTHQRSAIEMTTPDSMSHMASVNAWLADTVRCLGAMIDNADMYYYDGVWIRRTIPVMPGFTYAYQDVANLYKAAINCINIIDKLNKHK